MCYCPAADKGLAWVGEITPQDTFQMCYCAAYVIVLLFLMTYCAVANKAHACPGDYTTRHFSFSVFSVLSLSCYD